MYFIYRQNDTYIKAGVTNIIIWNSPWQCRRWASIFICGVPTVSFQTFQTPFSIICATRKQLPAIAAFLLLKLPWNMALAKLAIFWWEMLQKKFINNLCRQRQMLVQIYYSVIDTFEEISIFLLQLLGLPQIMSNFITVHIHQNKQGPMYLVSLNTVVWGQWRSSKNIFSKCVYDICNHVEPYSINFTSIQPGCHHTY